MSAECLIYPPKRILGGSVSAKCQRRTSRSDRVTQKFCASLHKVFYLVASTCRGIAASPLRVTIQLLLANAIGAGNGWIGSSTFPYLSVFWRLTTGLAGFAAGLVYSGVWLHILTPTQTAALIASYGIVNQSYSVWKLRNAFSWRRVLPFIAGSLVGVPIGVALLTSVSPAAVRIGVGVLLVAYASYNLLKPKIKPFNSGPVTDTGVGILNGMLGGLTGLGGVVITIWTQMRDWPKDVQRTVFSRSSWQP